MKKIKEFLNIESLVFIFISLFFLGIIFNGINYSLIHIFTLKIIFILVILIILVLFLIFVFWKKIKLIRINDNRYLLYLIIIILIIKILNIISISFSVEQISDFAVHLNNAVSNEPDYSNSVHFFHWALLAKTFQYFSIIFTKTQIGAIAFISIISIANTILLFYLATLITKNKKYAFIISLIYALWPSNILYTNLFSTEHIAITFIILSTIIFIKINEKFYRNEINNYYILALSLGLSLAILNFFKPVAIIILIAIIIYLIAYKNDLKQNIISKIICMIIVLITYYIGNHCLFLYLDNLTNERVNRNPSSFYIYMGLSPTNDRFGAYSPTIVKKYNQYYNKYQKDFTIVNHKLISDLKKEYDGNYTPLYDIITNKYKISWENDLSSLSWVSKSIKHEDKLIINKTYFIKILTVISEFYYIIVLCLYLIGVWVSLNNPIKNNYLLITNLFIIGFAFTLLLGETQGRYKIILYPFIAIQAFYGLKYIMRKH